MGGACVRLFWGPVWQSLERERREGKESERMPPRCPPNRAARPAPRVVRVAQLLLYMKCVLRAVSVLSRRGGRNLAGDSVTRSFCTIMTPWVVDIISGLLGCTTMDGWH